MTEEKKPQKKSSKRILSVDVLRGLTIVLMILVDDPGGKSFWFLNHPDWTGLTLADFIYPTFITLMGVSMYFSFSKYNFKANKDSVWRVVRRFIGLLLFGWIITRITAGISAGFAGKDAIQTMLDFAHMRILGVFPRLALCYLLGALIVLLVRNKKALIGVIAAILVGYAIILFVGNGFELNNNNVLIVFDKAVLGPDHMYNMPMSNGTKIIFDPEGLLSTLPCIAQVLLGFLIGGIVADKKCKINTKILNMFILGFSLLFVGYLCSFFLPAFKKAWTSTFVLITVGADACMLATLTWIIDVKNHKKWITFFRVYGANALVAFAAMDVVWFLLLKLKITTAVYEFLLPICFGVEGIASIVTTLLFILLLYILMYFLDKKKIYIRL